MFSFQDEDSMDKDGNELDGECSRPQKHAKSPELAREFLLDAATVIFKEQASLSFASFVINQVPWSTVKLLLERLYFDPFYSSVYLLGYNY